MHVLLNSGGLDTYLHAFRLSEHSSSDQVLSLFVDYGQTNREKERGAALWVARFFGFEFKEVSFRFPWWRDKTDICDESLALIAETVPIVSETEPAESGKDWEIPGRNAMFLLCALNYAAMFKSSRLSVWTGIDKRIPCFDQDPDVQYSALKNLAKCVGYKQPVDLVSPSVPSYQGLKLFYSVFKHPKLSPGDYLSNLWSCYNAFELQCGVCASCLDVQGSFLRAGVSIPFDFLSPDAWEELTGCRPKKSLFQSSDMSFIEHS